MNKIGELLEFSLRTELKGLIMTNKNPDDSVHEEQFNIEEDNVENTEDLKNEDEPFENRKSNSEEESIPIKPEPSGEEKTVAVDSDTDKTDVLAEKATTLEETEESFVDSDVDKTGDKIKDKIEEDGVVSDNLGELPEVDYSGRSKAELVETLEILIENRPPHEIKDDVDKIKILYYKKHKAELDIIKKEFLTSGGAPEDFNPPPDRGEEKVKSLLARYRGKKTEFSKQLEVEKQENLQRKYDIIDRIKDLVNREESINKTFQEFRELQNEWYSSGIVPQSALKNLWETYNHNVEVFYDYIKINKELRDLDFRKNLVTKIKLCEKAEELLLEPNPVNAFRILQEYHQNWREIGPVPRESRTEVWERFKEATAKINRAHHEYFEGLKNEQKKNLEAKAALCEQVEQLNAEQITSFKGWEDKAREVIELQKVWRTIGFAPKKYNNTIYQRFREECDTFFQSKRDFYARNKETQMENLQMKTDLCLKAESMKDSLDWKETTDALIMFQRQWKEIGAVPRKHSDKLWKRFRNACDYFFEKKSEHFSGLDNSFEENLKLKLALIERLEKYEPGGDAKETFEILKEIQNEWANIGFVPFKEKMEISNRYRNALNKQFDNLKIDEEEKAIIKYQNKLENLKENPKASRKLRAERERFINRIKQIESDIVLWENNIGFFSKSSSAESMIQEVMDKIENAKNTIQILEEKVRLIDKSGLDE